VKSTSVFVDISTFSTTHFIPEYHLHTKFPSKTMALRLGATLRGSKYSYRLVEKLGDKTVFSPVFKAEVLPGVQSLLPKNRWYVYNSAAFRSLLILVTGLL
jgi:hypothetical protein